MAAQSSSWHATRQNSIERHTLETADRASSNKPAANEKSDSEGGSEPRSTAMPRTWTGRAHSGVGGGTNATPQYYGIAPFTKLPFELFIEIANYLCPLDIIQLARVNRFLRGLLMHRTAIIIWRTARSNVQGLPPCPENLSEPRYAALLFLEECSTCGGAAPQDMDPILQVRLCGDCIGKVLADVTDYSEPDILLSSDSIVPTTSGVARRAWCLHDDAKAIEAEFRERQTGDQRDLTHWINGRLDVARKRYEQSRPLAQWLKRREEDRQRNARKVEIENRLLKMGWERIDFEPGDSWSKERWMSLVYSTQPLDSQTWNTLLAGLINHLKMNRERRLRLARLSALYEWLAVLRRRTALTPLATATPGNRIINGTLYGNAWAPWWYSVRMYLRFPFGDIVDFWPESKKLLDTDLPQEDFEQEFEAKKSRLTQLIDDWRYALELSLVEMLPSDTHPIDSNPPDFKLATSNGKSLEYLPMSTRKLLRADATFVVDNQISFYPNDFYNRPALYDSNLAAVARALLHVLGWPNASYMEMEVLRKSFICGRCNTRPVCRTWKEIIQHYLDEGKEWQRQSTRVGQNIQSGETFTLVFTHDIDLIDVDNPLVRTGRRPKDFGTEGVSKPQRCNLCHKFGIVFVEEEGYLWGHLRDVHFLGDIVEGVHYQPL